ncbi:MAG: HAMP domain-containing sensor histidine kinase, partial [Dehalococcoidia bacterium]
AGRAGAQDYLVKGKVGSDVLARTMRHAIERHRLLGRERELHQRESEFVAIASHELRTPLHAIRGFTRLLLDESVEPPEQREFLTTIDSEASRLGDIVNDLLDVAKIETGRLELRYEEISLAELIAGACAALETHASERRVELRQDSAEGLPRIQADPGCLSRVLVNLIANAIKFNNVGGTVTVRTWATSDEVVISIHDTGAGIPREARHRLFQRFSQVDASSTREHGGAGLGLYITKQLVESHEGRIWLESEVGRGTIVHVALPLRASRAGEARAA